MVFTLAIALTYRVATNIEWHAVVRDTRIRHWLALIGALTAMSGRYLIWSARLRLILSRVVPAPHFLVMSGVVFASVFVNHVTVSARFLGGLVRARHLSRNVALKFSQVYGVVLFDQLANQVTITTFTGIALLGVAWLRGYHRESAAAIAGLMVVAGLFHLFHRRHKPGQRKAVTGYSFLSRTRTGGDRPEMSSLSPLFTAFPRHRWLTW